MERQEVKTAYTWNVEDIFPNDEEWEKALYKIDAQINFGAYSGKLGNRELLLEYLKKNDEFFIVLERLFGYANLKHDQDTRVSKYTSFRSKVQMLYSKYCMQTAFYEAEMAEQSEEYLKSLLEDEAFAPYDYQIGLIIKGKSHVPTKDQQLLVAQASETLNSFFDIFETLNNSDLPLPEFELEGETKKITHGLFGLMLHYPDREKRKEAYEKYYAAFINFLNTITTIYYGNVKKDVLLSRAYKFDSCLEQALFNEDVDKKVYDNLLTCVKENCASMHRYISDRKKILGVDKLYFYDIYAPLVKDFELKMTYDEAYAYIVKGLAVLGKEYQDLLKKAYEQRWIDVEETDGKRSGAYSSGVYGVHPYVLLNYQGSITDVFTIAHEMGHALHSNFSNRAQPYAKCDYKIFVAEVASTVNEVLLLKYMLKEAKDVQLKKYLLNYYLDTIRATLHRQTMFAEFEYRAHEMVENGEPLTSENLCELYGAIGKIYYGDDIEHDYEISCEWCRVPHFYTSFYVYKYATGITAAINIVNRILTEGESAVKDYFKFLSGGSSTDPVSLLKLAGVDLGEKKAFDLAMKEFDDTLLEFEKLMEI